MYAISLLHTSRASAPTADDATTRSHDGPSAHYPRRVRTAGQQTHNCNSTKFKSRNVRVCVCRWLGRSLSASYNKFTRHTLPSFALLLGQVGRTGLTPSSTACLPHLRTRHALDRLWRSSRVSIGAGGRVHSARARASAAWKEQHCQTCYRKDSTSDRVNQVGLPNQAPWLKLRPQTSDDTRKHSLYIKHCINE